MPVAHTPNGDHATYLAHFESALDEWIRTGILGMGTALRRLLMEAIDHPTPEDLKAASEASQDGSVAYNLDAGTGKITVSPAIPHTEDTLAATNAEREKQGLPPITPAVPATTTTATAGSEQLADTSKTEGATSDNPEGTTGTGVLNETQVTGTQGSESDQASGETSGEQGSDQSGEAGQKPESEVEPIV